MILTTAKWPFINFLSLLVKQVKNTLLNTANCSIYLDIKVPNNVTRKALGIAYLDLFELEFCEVLALQSLRYAPVVQHMPIHEKYLPKMTMKSSQHREKRRHLRLVIGRR